MLRITLLTMSLVVFGACAKKGNWNAPAPQSKDDVGFIVSATYEEVDQLISENDLQARVISREDQLFEVFGASDEQIKIHIPTAQITKNVYFENLIPDSPVQAQIWNKTDKMTSWFSTMISQQKFKGLQNAAPKAELKRCLPTRNRPMAKLEVDGTLLSSPVVMMELGESIGLNGSKSEANPNAPSDLVIAWAVRGPEFSKLANQGIQIEEAIEFKPDALGAYEVMLLVQDENGGCGLSGAMISVTANPSFQGQPQRPELVEDFLKDFPHLNVVKAQEAWLESKGEGITIAVIDSGVDYAHPALLGNIFEFPNEIPGNNIDDDGNGYIDDVVGYDFANSDPFPFDDSGHGTHVAGLSSSPYFGSAPYSKVLPVKILNAAGGGDLASIVAGIYYAARSGVQIINGSIGAYSQDFLVLKDAIDFAESKGILMIFASGNGHPRTGQAVNIDEIPMLPAAFDNDFILAVGSTDLNSNMTFYSNYGVKTVDLLAPGGTPNVPLNSAAAWNPAGQVIIGHMGTSMAAPVVSGAAAVVWSKNPSYSALDIKNALLSSSTKKAELSNMISSGGVLNLQNAMNWNPNLQNSGEGHQQGPTDSGSIWDLFRF